MKIELTKEQINSLLQEELERRVNEQVAKISNDLVKIQSQLKEALQVIEGLLSIESAPAKRKFSDQEFLDMVNQGMTNTQIAKETGYNASYISIKKKKLLSQ